MENETILVLSFGKHERLHTVLSHALEGKRHEIRQAEEVADRDLRFRRILFALSLDEAGIELSLYRFLDRLRKEEGLLEGSVGALVVDGAGELYTKQAARSLTLGANFSGCAFPGRPLVEGTGSLMNLRIQAKRRGLSLMESYKAQCRELVERLVNFRAEKKERPKLLVLHASDHRTSNTLAIGSALEEQLKELMEIREISLQNGTVYDCRGCSYKACSHFAAQNSCFYGGSMVKEVHPAILDSDAILFLCPNYNDSVSANIMACINRLTSLQIHNSFFDKALYAVVVSGYSGSELVAEQLMGALNLNKGFYLPPRFCMPETANDPGEAMRLPGIEERLSRFAQGIRHQLLD